MKSQNWHSVKANIKFGVMAAHAFLMTRRSLPNDRLDLGTWHGYQEIFTNRIFTPSELKFRFFIPDNRYITLQLDRQPNGGYYGVIISRNARFRSGLIRVVQAGEKFTTYEEKPVDGLWSNKVHELKAIYSSTEISVYIDNALYARIAAPLREQAIGLKGCGYPGVWIDDINVIETNGNVWSENFSNRRNLAVVFWSAFVLFGLFLSTGLIFFYKKPQAYLYSLTQALVGLVLLVFLSSVDAYLFSNYYFDRNVALNFLMRDLNSENQTFKVVDQSVPTLVKKLISRFKETPKKGQYRVLLLGSSQTWGSGATSEQTTVSARLESILQNEYGFKNVTVINGGFPGFGTRQLYDVFTAAVDKTPEMVLLNMSFNDNSNPAEFTDYLFKFGELARQKKFRLVFSAEAFSNELGDVPIDNQIKITSAARALDIPLIDSYIYMNSVNNSGFLWWDIVHLSDVGQETLARYLAAQLNDTLKVEVKRRR